MDNEPNSRVEVWTSLLRGKERDVRSKECTRTEVQQRATEAPPPWHSKRLPSRLARSTRLEGDSKAREKAEEEERLRWVSEVTQLLLTLEGTPTAERAARTADPSQSAARMCSKVRAATVRSYVRAWRPLWKWWTAAGKQGLPSSSEAVLVYLEQRAAEPCAPSVLRRTRAALAFYEEAAGLTYAQRVSKCQWFNRQADALESTLTTTQKGQAWQTHSAYVAASEALVVNEQAAIVLRCYAFWRCLESWGALRFSDHRGLSPTECTVTEEAFKGVLVRTKTTGRDKKVLKRVLHIDRKCWLLHPEWMSVGWKLWQENAPWERDYFIPVPTKSLDHWERYECRYAEATVLSQLLETELVLNGEKLLCPDVPGRLWREHSPRAFLTSCTGCLRYPKNWQDALGGWSPGQSQAYVRTTRRRISIMQTKVAKLFREGQGEALGEKDLEEDLYAHMIKGGFSKEVAREQIKNLKNAREFVAKSASGAYEEVRDEKQEREDTGDDVSTEEEAIERSDEDSVEDSVAVSAKTDLACLQQPVKRVKVQSPQDRQDSSAVPQEPEEQISMKAQRPQSSADAPVKRERTGRTPGIVETKPRRRKQEKARPEPAVVLPGYLVANGHKLRCLHYVGRCWRLPGRDIKNWQFYGQQQPTASEYDHYCRQCWSRGTLPGGDSEAAHTAEDSGSSSTDA